jgi:hypothetical protein
MTRPIRKRSYTVPCSSAFRDTASAHAEKLNVNVADLARSAVLLAPQDVIADFPDPGPPDSGDRETVILKSGPAKGRPWRRKPRLQVRMGPGLTVPFIRRCLALALAVGEGRLRVRIESTGPAAVAEVESFDKETIKAADAEALRELHDEAERLRTVVSALSFEPLAGGIKTRQDALHIFGLAPDNRPDAETLRSRFRMLATIYHPDGPYGSHRRMAQINAAMTLLRTT